MNNVDVINDMLSLALNGMFCIFRKKSLEVNSELFFTLPEGSEAKIVMRANYLFFLLESRNPIAIYHFEFYFIKYLSNFPQRLMKASIISVSRPLQF